jgi:mitogen-activated protein kinase 15
MSEDIDEHVLRKYEILQRLGRGAYGIVWKAVSRKNNQIVALKKCFDAFQNSTDAQRTFREIMYLQELHGHDNIVGIQNVLRAENDRDIYIVTDFMESDLHAVIKGGILEEVHKQYVLYQIVRALKYMHSGELIHRDIKPSNILLNADCTIKLCDFGLARSVATTAGFLYDTNPVMTDYVATRWYRAPEILLGSPYYTKGVDIWAVGCILAEMLVGKPVFPGTSTLDQLERVLTVTGVPTAEDIESIQSPFAITMLGSLNVSNGRKALVQLFPKATPDMLDLLEQCFRFNPNKRPTAKELLSHPLFEKFHDPKWEPSAPRLIQIPLDDNVKLTVGDYRTRIYEMIVRRKQEINSKRKPEAPVAQKPTTEETTTAPTPQQRSPRVDAPPKSSVSAAAPVVRAPTNATSASKYSYQAPGHAPRRSVVGRPTSVTANAYIYVPSYNYTSPVRPTASVQKASYTSSSITRGASMVAKSTAKDLPPPASTANTNSQSSYDSFFGYLFGSRWN